MYDWLDTKKTTWAAITIKKETQSIEKRILSVFGELDFTKISPQQWLTFFSGYAVVLNNPAHLK